MSNVFDRAAALLKKRGDHWTDEKVAAVFPDVLKQWGAGAGNLENAVNYAAKIHETREQTGSTRHGSQARRRGY